MYSKMKFEHRKQYLSIESYKKGIEVLDIFTSIILFSFAQHSITIKDIIIRNFIARTITTLKGIMKLWEISDYHDCWVLHRCILDRLFHLKALAKNDSFKIFEKWSFKQQYDAKNKIRSDPEFKGKLDPGFFKDMDEQKERYAIICKEKIQWRRPKPEEMAKEMDLDFLYKYGYDYASTLVHPMANDGQEDFYRLTNPKEIDLVGDHRAVINNSCLAMTVLIQEGLNNSNFAWRSLIYDFLGDFRDFLISGTEKYLISFYKILSLGPRPDLCKKTYKKSAIK